MLVLAVALFHGAGLYRARLSLSVLDDAPVLVGRALAAGAGAMVLGGLNDGVAGTARLGTAAVFGLLCLAGRGLAYAGLRTARRHRRLQQRALLLGAGTVAGTLASNLLAHPEYGLLPEGLLDDDPLLCLEERPVPVLGTYDDLCTVLAARAIDVVIVTFGRVREPLVVDMLRACDRMACEILFVPRLYEMHAVTKDTEVLWGVPLVRLRRAPFRGRHLGGQAARDVALAALALVVLVPVLCGLRAARAAGRPGRCCSARLGSGSTAGPSRC